MLKIKNNILEKELAYDNTVVLKYHIEYPTIIINNNKIGEFKFNTYNEGLALQLKKRAENELYNDSIKLYKFNKENGYPQRMYEVYRKYEITLNSGNILSLYTDDYVYTGGAHGDTVRTSQTWNFRLNRTIELYELYRRNPYFILDILKSISQQIFQNPENYFANACNLMIVTFNPKNFYLTPNGVVIYFQHYDIAPYSSGIPTFLITNNN